jgi:hypothetical protein
MSQRVRTGTWDIEIAYKVDKGPLVWLRKLAPIIAPFQKQIYRVMTTFKYAGKMEHTCGQTATFSRIVVK